MSEHPMTAKILARFTEITQVPRKSKQEEKICEWLKNWAAKNNFQTKTDKVNNLVILVPGTPGFEKAPTLVLQGHMDMVCEKTPDSPIDPSKDALKLLQDGEWLKADRTTLGADNGIAIAIATVLAESKDVSHPPLELLFTVDEETGLTGANALESDFLTGKLLLNLDSEDEGVFTVGCAGGKTSRITLPLNMAPVPATHKAYNVVVGDLKGGHSGVDIHCERANAIQVLCRSLYDLEKIGGLMIADLKGGSAHNAIPRDSSGVIFLAEKDFEKAQKSVEKMEKVLRVEYANTDPNLKITIQPSTTVFAEATTPESSKKLVNFVLAIPHGVAAMSTELKGLVETSDNLATIAIADRKLQIVTSQRSAVMSRLESMTTRIESLVQVAGGEIQHNEGYPSWAPNMKSPLLARCIEVYKNTMHKEPKVEAIHAGLECGIIGSKYPGMDMISFGPTIKNPHSPDERLHVPSVGLIWDFLVALGQSYGKNIV